jgi:hypothetical protein
MRVLLSRSCVNTRVLPHKKEKIWMSTKVMTILLSLGVVVSYNQNVTAQAPAVEVWKLGWRVIASSMEENYELTELQFDSLLNITNEIDRKYLVTGLEAKYKLGKIEEITKILNTQDENVLQQICTEQFLVKMEPCTGLSIDEVGNKELQIELIKMFIDDQAARGNLMQNIIAKYNIDSTKITQGGGVVVDERNRNRLKEIFKEYGFPTRKLVGKDAMHGIFLMIQHSDRDIEWQRLQLSNIEKAVKNGDMDGQSYAYLYDRIKINNGEKQLYGTQFSKVDPINKTVELAPTEDMENLDRRRMEIGMMPIEMYKEFMLKNL